MRTFTSAPLSRSLSPPLSALALTACLLLSGCAKLGSLGNLDQYKPTIKFDSVSLSGLSWTGADANFVFKVTSVPSASVHDSSAGVAIRS